MRYEHARSDRADAARYRRDRLYERFNCVKVHIAAELTLRLVPADTHVDDRLSRAKI